MPMVALSQKYTVDSA